MYSVVSRMRFVMVTYNQPIEWLYSPETEVTDKQYCAHEFDLDCHEN